MSVKSTTVGATPVEAQGTRPEDDYSSLDTPFKQNGHLQRGDFSNWVRDVFDDHQLAGNIRQLEGDYRLNRNANINDAIAQAVRGRYEFALGPIE